MPESDSTSNQIGGELSTTADLRSEAAAMAALIEEINVVGGLLKDWQETLPDNYEAGHAAGGPRTRALDEAVSAVSEAGDDGQAFSEGLTAIRLACDQADALGDHASSMGALGHTSGYVPA